MRELTRNEIIKTLECCESHGNCQECPLSGKDIKGCMFNAMHEALELIKELCDELKFQEEQYDRVYEQAEADIRGNMADGGTSCHWCMNKTKADIVKKMQEKLNDTKFKIGSDYYIYANNVDVIAKELLEENK